MLETLWPRIEAGDETPKVELKRSLWNLSTGKGKAEFVKDVTALANTSGGDGYLVIGVLDKKERQDLPVEDPFAFVCGVSHRSHEQIGVLERQMNQALETYSDPPPSVGYAQHLQSGRWIGVVTVPCSSRRPHVIIRGGEEIKPQDIWVRRGEFDAACFKASRAELEEMFAKRGFTVTSHIDPTDKGGSKPVAFAVGLGGSIQGAVMKWLYDHQLQMPVRDYSSKGFIPVEQFDQVLQEFRKVKNELTNEGATEVHLFYKGPVTLAMALGALFSDWVPIKVYAFVDGVYRLQITLDRRMVRGS